MAEFISSDTINVGKGDVIWLKRFGTPVSWVDPDDYPLVCPEQGAFVGYKLGLALNEYLSLIPCIIKLSIPEDAKRSSAYGNKCRCDKAKVLNITTFGGEKRAAAISWYSPDFVYEVNKEVSVPDFDEDRWHECAPGIHFFMSEKEALDYWRG